MRGKEESERFAPVISGPLRSPFTLPSGASSYPTISMPLDNLIHGNLDLVDSRSSSSSHHQSKWEVNDGGERRLAVQQNDNMSLPFPKCDQPTSRRPCYD